MGSVTTVLGSDMLVRAHFTKLAKVIQTEVLAQIRVPLLTCSFITVLFIAHFNHMMFAAVKTKLAKASLVMLAHPSLHFQFPLFF